MATPRLSELLAAQLPLTPDAIGCLDALPTRLSHATLAWAVHQTVLANTDAGVSAEDDALLLAQRFAACASHVDLLVAWTGEMRTRTGRAPIAEDYLRAMIETAVVAVDSVDGFRLIAKQLIVDSVRLTTEGIHRVVTPPLRRVATPPLPALEQMLQ